MSLNQDYSHSTAKNDEHDDHSRRNRNHNYEILNSSSQQTDIHNDNHCPSTSHNNRLNDSPHRHSSRHDTSKNISDDLSLLSAFQTQEKLALCDPYNKDHSLLFVKISPTFLTAVDLAKTNLISSFNFDHGQSPQFQSHTLTKAVTKQPNYFTTRLINQ